MAQAIAETVFDCLYLSFALASGLWMLCRGRSAMVRRAGWMAFLLGAGDAFHLVPRCYALWTTGLAANAALLGVGKLVTSVTMTVFYLLLYHIWRAYYGIRGRQTLSCVMWSLGVLRIALCLLPQNDWLSPAPPLLFGVLRNVPFAAMGVLIIVLFAQEVRRSGDRVFRHMPLAVGLSFGFYLPVVLLSAAVPAVGMLMIPKTLAYVWCILMCLRLHRDAQAA